MQSSTSSPFLHSQAILTRNSVSFHNRRHTRNPTHAILHGNPASSNPMTGNPACGNPTCHAIPPVGNPDNPLPAILQSCNPATCNTRRQSRQPHNPANHTILHDRQSRRHARNPTTCNTRRNPDNPRTAIPPTRNPANRTIPPTTQSTTHSQKSRLTIHKPATTLAEISLVEKHAGAGMQHPPPPPQHTRTA